jgi:glycosyltransferase involved in cell wall biosynthesis
MIPPTLLCVSNEVTGFGFAWTHFEHLFARVADRMADVGARTLVAYPKITQDVPALAGSAARVVELDATSYGVQSVRAVARFARAENVRAILCIDRFSLHGWTYGLPRLSGVRRILVYNQTSGSGYPSSPPKRLAKSVLAQFRWMTPDVVIGVSDFVVRREAVVSRVPRRRLVRLHNAVALPPAATISPPAHERLGIEASRPIILAGCRAVYAKGVHHLFRAFDILLSDYPADRPRPVLVYVGSGPQFEELAQMRLALASGESIVMTGYRTDVGDLHTGATICVVPSIYQDACPFAVLEAMARGCAVVGTRVGGVPEMIDSDAVGLLVAPGDEPGMAAALRRLLDDPGLRAALGRNARQRVAEAFNPEDQADRLAELIHPAFHEPGGSSGQ